LGLTGACSGGGGDGTATRCQSPLLNPRSAQWPTHDRHGLDSRRRIERRRVGQARREGGSEGQTRRPGSRERPAARARGGTLLDRLGRGGSSSSSRPDPNVDTIYCIRPDPLRTTPLVGCPRAFQPSYQPPRTSSGRYLPSAPPAEGLRLWAYHVGQRPPWRRRRRRPDTAQGDRPEAHRRCVPLQIDALLEQSVAMRRSLGGEGPARSNGLTDRLTVNAHSLLSSGLQTSCRRT
jgi:hypothetical protein